MAEKKGVKIIGYVTANSSINNEEFLDKFIEWIEANDYQFCGSCMEYKVEEE